jgi:hypothetical protein
MGHAQTHRASQGFKQRVDWRGDHGERRAARWRNRCPADWQDGLNKRQLYENGGLL